MTATDTIVLPSSSFTWMGHTGFAEMSELERVAWSMCARRPGFCGTTPTRFSVCSGRTGSEVEFNRCDTKRDAEDEVVSWTYEGLDDAGNLITLIVFND